MMVHDLLIEQGATFEIDVEYLDADGDPVDLTDYTALAQMRTNLGDADVALEFTIDDTQAADGILTLTATATETGALTRRWGFWDLKVTKDDISTRIAKGRVKVDPAVAREPVP